MWKIKKRLWRNMCLNLTVDCAGGVRRHDRNRAVAEQEIASALRRWRNDGVFLAVGLDRPGPSIAVVGEELGHGRVVVPGRVERI